MTRYLSRCVRLLSHPVIKASIVAWFSPVPWVNMTGRGCISQSRQWLIAAAGGSPSWWMNMHCLRPLELKWGTSASVFGAPRLCTSLIIIFTDEYCRSRDDEVAICLCEDYRTQTRRLSLCRWPNLAPHRPVVPCDFPTSSAHTHTHTHVSFSFFFHPLRLHAILALEMLFCAQKWNNVSFARIYRFFF